MITSRRKFFGLMAAPAIIGISGRMSMWVPTVIVPQYTLLNEHGEEIDAFTTADLRWKAKERYLTSYKYDWRAVYGTPGQ